MDAHLLTAGELESLRELTLGSVRQRIHSAHAARLVSLGLARETADGFAITSRGRTHLSVAAYPRKTSPRLQRRA